MYIQSTFYQVPSFLIEGDRRYSFQTPHLSARPPRWYIISPPFTEERTEQTRSFVRRVRSATRRKYTSEEKIRIVLEGFRREVTVSDLCRREGIKPHSYYSWTKEFMEAGKERLARDSVRDATRQEIHALKRENGELKQLVADLSLEAYRLKKTALPMMEDGAGTSA